MSLEIAIWAAVALFWIAVFGGSWWQQRTRGRDRRRQLALHRNQPTRQAPRLDLTVREHHRPGVVSLVRGGRS